MISTRIPQLPRGRMFAAVAAMSVIGSFMIAAPASATVVNCNSNTKNWAALYPTVGDWLLGEGATHCIGNKSTNGLPSNNTEVFCAGNNSGYVKYYDRTTGTTATHTFWPDTSDEVVDGTHMEAPVDAVVDVIDVEQVQITGWSGSAGC